MAAEILTITDPDSGSSAKILVSQGFNCYSFEAMVDAQPVEVLWAHPNFESGGERPSGSGIPILFPFAGRIPGTSYEYEGRTYELEEGDGRGNAIHGFVMQRPWRIDQRERSRVVGQFHMSVDEPELIQRWPADFRIVVSYEVLGGTLRSEIFIENPGEKPLPFGFATHAYFRLPVGVAGGASETIVRVPVQDEWELADLIPTGKRVGHETARELAAGVRLGERPFDNAFADIVFEDGRAETTLENPTTGRRIVQTFDETFRHVVVYTPPHREAICMEPYTCLPNPFRLEEQRVETGFRLLAPGDSLSTTIDIRLE